MKQYLTPEHIKHNLANLPQLVFEVTDACNLRCKYCAYGEFYDDYDCRESKDLSVEWAIRLIDYLVPYWNSGRNVSAQTPIWISFYGGEPLLNFPFIERIVDYVLHGIDCPRHRFSFSMTTNAILLHRYMDFLQEHDFSLLISLDGNEANDAYRMDKAGHSSYARVVENVNALREKYPDYFERRVNFNAVLHNKNSVEEIYRFFKEKYGKMPRIGELNTVGIRRDKVKEFNRTYRNAQESLHQAEHYEEIIEEDLFMDSTDYRSLAMYLFQYSGYVYQDYAELLYDKSRLATLPTGTCLPFEKKMFVTVNGKLLPCERIGHQFALGKVTAEGIDLNPEAIADTYNHYYAQMEDRCATCRNSRACIQCLFNLPHPEENPVCHGYMDENRFRRLEAQQLYFLSKHPEAYRKIMEKVIRM